MKELKVTQIATTKRNILKTKRQALECYKQKLIRKGSDVKVVHTMDVTESVERKPIIFKHIIPNWNK